MFYGHRLAQCRSGRACERTRDIAIKAWNNVRVHVEKGWIAVVARWATVSPKLTAARKQLKRRAPTKVTNREVPIQVPAYMAPETETLPPPLPPAAARERAWRARAVRATSNPCARSDAGKMLLVIV